MKKILDHERVCANCGDTFLMSEGWKFKRSKGGKVHVFCTWGCMKAWDMGNRKYPAKDRREMMIEMIGNGLTNGEIMVRLGYSYEEIDRCRERMARDENRAD